MKKMFLLMLLALVASTGCCRAWPNWFGRGDDCLDYPAISGMPVCDGTPIYDGYPIYDGSTLAPAPATTLPGPVKATN